MAVDDAPQVSRNDRANRFELTQAPEQAHLAYRDDGERLTLVHTEVADELEGQGVGSLLVRASVRTAAAHGRVVVPECRFAAGWLERHPDTADQVEIVWP